jgi:uncharacterized SAM-binding protein YcdF (DUF218 family)
MTYTQPLTLLSLLVIAAGLYGLRRSSRTIAWWIGVCGCVGLGVLTWSPAAGLLARPLVGRYTKTVRPAGDAEAIVVLSGAVNDPTDDQPYVLVGLDTYRRDACCLVVS